MLLPEVDCWSGWTPMPPQLAVYLRLNNIPVAAMYGPSADEGM